MSLKALKQNVQIATEALELERLLAGYNDAAPEVVAAQAALSNAQQQLIRAEAIAKQERDHAETCRIAATMAQAPTEAEALEILRKANAVIADQQADAQHHRDAAADTTERKKTERTYCVEYFTAAGTTLYAVEAESRAAAIKVAKKANGEKASEPAKARVIGPRVADDLVAEKGFIDLRSPKLATGDFRRRLGALVGM